MKISDMHTHSNNSFDAENTVDELCASAVNKGMYAIAITDHCEAPFIEFPEKSGFGNFSERIPKSVRETIKAKQKYASKLKVLCGMELGEPMHDLECTKKALNFGDFDFVLASVHNLKNMQDFYYLDYSKYDEQKLLAMYFDELIETSLFEHFDSLAHLTYPLRYIKASTGRVPNLQPYNEQIDEIFINLIKNNKALEINVSGLYKELFATLPDKEQLLRYYQLGGRLITIGTDSHKANAVGVGIDKGIELARSCGFTHYAIYEKHQPIFIPFD